MAQTRKNKNTDDKPCCVVTRRSFLAGFPSVWLAGCLSGENATETGTGTVVPSPGATGYWYTDPSPTGNRFIEGQGELRGANRVDIETDGTPRWLLAHPEGSGSSWTVVTEDGTVSRWYVVDGEATVERSQEPLPRGFPPVVATYDGESSLVRPPEGMPVTATPTVTGFDAPKVLYVNDEGDLVVAERVGGGGDPDEGSVETTLFSVDSIPDARIVEVGGGKYALFGDSTSRYRHGALGDNIEGSSLVVYDSVENEVSSRTELESPDVFEGLSPMVADVDRDGQTEIVTTVANSSEGARIAVFGADGERIATGPVHEPGWRHQIAVAPLGADGETEIGVVRKPHVERVLEFYRLRRDSLEVVDSLGGFQSHTYGSRNLGGGVAVDADGDGTTELLVPTAQRDEVAAVRRLPDGAEAVWHRSLEGSMTSNITGVSLKDGIAVGVGDGSGVRIWQA